MCFSSGPKQSRLGHVNQPVGDSSPANNPRYAHIHAFDVTFTCPHYSIQMASNLCNSGSDKKTKKKRFGGSSSTGGHHSSSGGGGGGGADGGGVGSAGCGCGGNGGGG